MVDNEKIVKSACELCNEGCGVLVHLKDGKPVKIEGDPDNPVNRGAICIKGMAALEHLNHPDRIKYPYKRIGGKGSGRWERITWVEALDTIATKLNEAKNKYGAESVAVVRGSAKGYQDSYVARFANVIGTPNFVTMSNICHIPRRLASVLTCGFMPLPDYEHPPACIMMWAMNTCSSAIGECKRTNEAISKGSKLIVIDPGETVFTRRANIWVRPRPASDLALALTMINVIINEGLYDKEFVEKWTAGFDKLKAHVQSYTPEQVEEIVWVPADTIKKAARLYATSKPACIAWGNGIDNYFNNFQTARAISILRAITGNLGQPGGDIDWTPSPIMQKTSPDLLQERALAPDIRARRIGAGKGRLPIVFVSFPHDLNAAVLEGKPYPIHAAFIMGCSILHTATNAKETYQALNNIDFLAVSDFFMTPTAELADIVLPVGTFLEIDSFHEGEYIPAVNIIQKVAQVGECWSDLKIFNELAKRMGLGKFFWDNEEQALDYILKPAGLTFEKFREVGVIAGSKQYRKHEKNGFNTPSGKVELYSSQLEKWGFDPLPVYREPPESPYSEPELAKEYPLVFTNWKLPPFQHSCGRQINTLRRNHPEPLVVINTGTAKKLDIKNGDQVYIETKRGKIKQKASLSSKVDPRVVLPEFGWWFPEKESELHGWAESNINVLTDNKPPLSREMGTPGMRGILCKVYKAT